MIEGVSQRRNRSRSSEVGTVRVLGPLLILKLRRRRLKEKEEERKSRYEVGYGKPPIQGRFLKGRSGNPKGRPKKAKGFRTIVHQQLETPVEVRINGRVTKISKREAIIAQMVNKAATGDSRSAELLLLKLDLLQRDWQAPGKPNGLDPEALERAKILVRGHLD